MSFNNGDKIVLQNTTAAINHYPQYVGVVLMVISTEQDRKSTWSKRIFVELKDGTRKWLDGRYFELV
jgi:hypothetical protein